MKPVRLSSASKKKLTSFGRFFYGVEHWTKLGKPFRFDRAHLLHVLLRCHDKIVVNNIVRVEPQPEQGTSRMKVARHSGPGVDVSIGIVRGDPDNASQQRSLRAGKEHSERRSRRYALSDAFEPGGLVEV